MLSILHINTCTLFFFRINKRLNSPQDQSQIFAHALESKHWRFGNCEEDIIIFYSVEDQIVNAYFIHYVYQFLDQNKYLKMVTIQILFNSQKERMLISN